MARTLEKRRIGQSSLEITTLGLGCASLAGIFSAVPADQARATIHHALDAGLNHVDTAPQYGLGRSEHLVGDVVRTRRAETILSTKVGRLLKPVSPDVQDKGAWVDPLPFDQVYDYSYDGIMRSFEDSLQRLGVNNVDILYVHDIGVATHGVEANKPLWQQLASGGYRALRELRDTGVVSAIGLGVNEWEVLMDAMTLGDWDVFLLAGRYTLLEQTALAPFMTTAAQRGSSVVVGGPFNSGILVGGTTFNYAKAPEAIVARVKAIETVCNQFNVPLPAAALQFPLTHPVVCNVLPGPRSPAELDGILDWWDVAIPAELWTTLAEKGLLASGTPIPGGTA
ncbi:aldo/keto reductase [Devosia neptuniae]|jgi:D-threo-aldose 1-dehydrogenase|uniref:aldo/keto reductase n=1 Tax=Devosia TaxID=46913 RepID=UPI0022AF81CB|nr:aldo/keto reductase [Devosia neptuniae]MCZ4345908.1 aldo/keto reductase [Devosia neptuniae]|tara:strand:+ start:20729 stop:21745 length:1017 start_codon:yes stop_codon:yes gene_type:complete